MYDFPQSKRSELNAMDTICNGGATSLSRVNHDLNYYSGNEPSSHWKNHTNKDKIYK